MALSDPVKAEAAAIIGSNEPVNLKMVLLNQLWLKHGLASHPHPTKLSLLANSWCIQVTAVEQCSMGMMF